MRGSTPTTALLTIRANGFKLYDLIAFSLANKIAAAPSFKPEALPAVTVPSLRKEGFNFCNPSKVVLAFANSSVLKTKASPFFVEFQQVQFLFQIAQQPLLLLPFVDSIRQMRLGLHG